ncbi:MAG: hypothetical protein SFY96_01075 [Planctomycetota bacterium]|nr:hypothetical protein [Planctomycetota bacterium]
MLISDDPGGFVMHGRVNAAVCADGHADVVKSHDDLTLDPTQSRAAWADVKESCLGRGAARGEYFSIEYQTNS